MSFSLINMSLINSPNVLQVILRRQIHVSSIYFTEGWRKSKGLPKNRTTYGPLLDLPDFTYLDGRPTPIGSRQNTRLNNRIKMSEKIIQSLHEVDFAKQRFQDMKNEKEEKRKRLLSEKLKDKGDLLLKNDTTS